MRVRKEIKIGEVGFVVLELTLRQIIDYFQSLTNAAEVDDAEEETNDTMSFFKTEIHTLLNLALEGDHKVDDFLDFRPSELKEIYDSFKEVNEVFFDTAAQLGIAEVLDSMKSLIQSEFSDLLVSSSKAAITRSLTTGTPTS